MSYTLQDSLAMHEHWAHSARYGEQSPVNVFYLDAEPTLAARAHCDRHIGAQLLATVQLLSTAWWTLAPNELEAEWDIPHGPVPPRELRYLHHRLAGQRVYARRHESHPCAVWATEHAGNYDWLWRLGAALCEEHRYRFKNAAHPAEAVLRTLEIGPSTLPVHGAWTEPPLVMPAEFWLTDADECYDAVGSYRRWYVAAHNALLKWTRRGPPHWLTEVEGQFRLKERV